MVDKKVYCKECIFLIWPHKQSGYKCSHDSNKIVTTNPNWFSINTSISYKKAPSEINKNNDCPNHKNSTR